MKKKLYFSLLFILTTLVFGSCNNDYIIGGKVNDTSPLKISTFELLSRMQETDTVAILFDRAGLKDSVNGDVTVISPNQWSVNRYLRRRYNQDLRNNPNAPIVTIDDISNEDLQQMRMYIFPGKYWRETIPKEGVHLVALDGTEALLTLDKTNTDPGCAWDGGGSPGEGYQYSNFMQSVPYVIHIHFKRGVNWEWTEEERNSLPDNYDNPECDQIYRMYVSDILTSTGVVHVLYQGDNNWEDHYNYHTLFFYGKKSDDKL